MCEEPRTDEDAPVSSSLRGSSQDATCDATKSIKAQTKEGAHMKTNCPNGAHKGPAVGSPQVVEPTTSNPPYVPIQDSKSFGINNFVMCQESGEVEAHTISADTAYLEEIDSVLPIHVDVKKMCRRFNWLTVMGWVATEPPPKRNPKHQKETIKEHYIWVLPCFDVIEDVMHYERIGMPKVAATWATCKICKFKSPGCREYGMKTKPYNCASWSGCVKHAQNIHYLEDPNDVEEVLADPKAHWDSLEESKARKHAIETRYQGQSRLDKCVEEFGCRSTEMKRCVKIWRVCAMLIIYLCISAPVQGLQSSWGSKSLDGQAYLNKAWQKSVDQKSWELRAEIKCKTLEIAAKIDIAFTTDFWTSPETESFMAMSMHWIIRDWRLKTHILGTTHFPKTDRCKRFWPSFECTNKCCCMTRGCRRQNSQKWGGPAVWQTCILRNGTSTGQTGVDKWLRERCVSGRKKRRPLGLESLRVSLSEHICAVSSEMSCSREVCGTLGGVDPQVLQKQVFMEGVREGSIENAALGGWVQRRQGRCWFWWRRGTFLWCKRQAASKKNVEVVDTSVETLELHVILY